MENIVFLIAGIIVIVGVVFFMTLKNSSEKKIKKSEDKNENNNLPDYGSLINLKKCPKCNTTVREKVKICPHCGHKFPKPTKPKSTINHIKYEKYCPDCGRDFMKTAVKCNYCGNTKLEDRKYKNKKIVTKHINKNGLSFDYPDYYDIGNYPSSDEYHQSIVALSHRERKCEIYIMEYRPNHFDNRARHNPSLLKEYLKMQGYTFISEKKEEQNCFTADIHSQLGKLKTTIVFNFNYSNAIMIVGNIPGNSYYYKLIKDIKIINKTIELVE